MRSARALNGVSYLAWLKFELSVFEVAVENENTNTGSWKLHAIGTLFSEESNNLRLKFESSFIYSYFLLISLTL